MTVVETPVKAGRNNIVADLIAGITTALVTIPDGMASAILAGVNPLNGLNALMVGTPVAALLASSQFMFVANTRTETIELIGIDRAYRAEPEVFAAARKAVRDAQRQD